MLKRKIVFIAEILPEIMIAIVFAWLLTRFITPSVVSGNSMYPSLKDKDYLLINRIAYRVTKPSYGDIIVFKSDIQGHKKLIKRIVALEGDRLQIENGKLYINDVILNESYLASKYTPGKVNTTIPNGFIFVLGDNRNHSLDSRFSEIGFIDIHDILGKVLIKIF